MQDLTRINSDGGVFRLTNCRKHTEKIQKFSDPEITVCAHCAGALERVLSAPAISFKGGGWFKDGSAQFQDAAAPLRPEQAARV